MLLGPEMEAQPTEAPTELHRTTESSSAATYSVQPLTPDQPQPPPDPRNNAKSTVLSASQSLVVPTDYPGLQHELKTSNPRCTVTRSARVTNLP